MYNTVQSSPKLQYAMELASQGLISVCPRPYTMSLSECLRKLRSNSISWSSFDLNCTRSLHINVGITFSSIAHNHLYISACSPESQTHYRYKSQVTDLKTGTKLTTHTHVVESNLHLTCIDHRQDLMVYVSCHDSPTAYCYTMTFKTISTNVSHPLARELSIMVELSSHETARMQTCVLVDVFDERIASCLLVTGSHADRSYVDITNWKHNTSYVSATSRRITLQMSISYYFTGCVHYSQRQTFHQNSVFH